MKERVNEEHARLLQIVPRRPEDYRPWGNIARWEDPAKEYPDCSGGCAYARWLEGDLSFDWCVCTNPDSHRVGLLTFEHQGCQEFTDELKVDSKASPLEPLLRRRRGSVPWYITVRAVQDYLGIQGLPETITDGPEFEEAEAELMTMARGIVDAGKEGRPLASGTLQYRGPRPLRVRLWVATGARAEGDLPQLVRVLPDHEGRTAPYRNSR